MFSTIPKINNYPDQDLERLEDVMEISLRLLKIDVMSFKFYAIYQINLVVGQPVNYLDNDDYIDIFCRTIIIRNLEFNEGPIRQDLLYFGLFIYHYLKQIGSDVNLENDYLKWRNGEFELKSGRKFFSDGSE